MIPASAQARSSMAKSVQMKTLSTVTPSAGSTVTVSRHHR